MIIEVANPAIMAVIEMSLVRSSPDSNIIAPIIAGMDNIKENAASFSLFTPAINPVAIVDPLLDIPGMIAIPWAIPINIECL